MIPSHDTVAPGVLRVFRRTLVGLWVLLAVVWGVEVVRPPAVPDTMDRWGWLLVTLLLGYLSWDRLHHWLGQAYLPLALWVSACGPVIVQFAGTAHHLRQGLRGEAALIDPNSLYLWLLVPLLLISVHYQWCALLGFTVGTTVVTIGLTTLLVRAGGFTLHSTITSALDRLVIFTVAGGVILLLSQAQRRQRQELAQRQAELAHYALTVEQLTVSRERNRLARDLHDTLAHTLSAISVQLGAMDVLWERDPAAARAVLQQTTALTRAGLDEARGALHDLRDRPVAALGLALALRHLAEQVAASADLHLTLTLAAPLAGGSPEREQQLYRIATEALSNVVRHAQAHQVSVTLEQKAAQLHLTISDDGVGFDPEQSPIAGHYGLTGMRERALVLQAQLTITSRPGGGTVLRVVAPW